MGYLTVDGFKLETTMPTADVDELELSDPGFLLARLNRRSAYIDSRLRKRYVVPFQSPYPDTVCQWLIDIVTWEAYRRRGFSPSSEMDKDSIEGPALKAMAEIEEAANGNTGLFDLPLTATSTESGITRGGTLGYSEASPYKWQTEQAEAGRLEDYS